MLSKFLFYFSASVIVILSLLKAIIYQQGSLKAFFYIYIIVVLFEIALEYIQLYEYKILRKKI